LPNFEGKIWETLYGGCPKNGEKEAPLKVGQYVRISKYKGKFEKGYLANWSREIFRIKLVKRTQPVTYVIEDQNDNEMRGTFYRQELQAISNLPDTFRIESILAHRKRQGRKQILVKWADYPEEFNSWVDARDVVDENK
jgi:hypothetical protein